MKQFKMLVSKIAIALIALLSIFVKLAYPVSADGGDDRIVVYAQVPDDWKNPCVWAWDDDGNSAFDMWPGGEMEEDKDNEGWNYIYIPSWANHIILNANKGEVQADEIVLDEAVNTWVIVNASDDVSVTTDKLTTGDIPEYVEKFAVHVRVADSWGIPFLQGTLEDGTAAFDKEPGKEMVLDASNWYTANIPVSATSITVISNDGESKTEDIRIDAAQVWVSVEADGTYEFSYKDPEKAAAPNITVHVTTPGDWDTPCLWAWSAPDGTGVYSTWPGEAFEEGDNGWLIKEVPGWVNSIIVNACDGSVQTSDISIDSGVDVWVVVTDKDTYDVYYEEPEVTTGNADNADEAEKETDTAGIDNSADGQEVAGAKRDGNSTGNALPMVGGIAGVVAVAGAGVFLTKRKSRQ